MSAMLVSQSQPIFLKRNRFGSSNRLKRVIISARTNCSRRDVILIGCTVVFSAVDASAIARERRNKQVIPIEEYKTTEDGVKYYDISEGKGPAAEPGKTVLVHFDCVYRGIDAVSSRESKLLGGNRIVAEPYELVVGAPPGRERKRGFAENANGLFSAQAAPKPPPALYKLVQGMKVGGKRTVIVTPDLGYGDKGLNEIPPNATFNMSIELLELRK